MLYKIYSSISSKSSDTFLLRQESPQQSPHCGVQKRPNFLQVHKIKHSDFLQLQKIKSKMNFGATSLTPWFGIRLFPFIIHPHSKGFNELPHHFCIWWYTRYKCCSSANRDGGREARSVSLLSAFLALTRLNFMNLNLFSQSTFACAPYNFAWSTLQLEKVPYGLRLPGKKLSILSTSFHFFARR